MPSRREFLGWVFGLWAIRGPEGGRAGLQPSWQPTAHQVTPVHKRERPAESMQELIEQIRFLERQDIRRQEHVQAIQDQIRIRLLLAGLACVYGEEDGQLHVCALETKTGSLWSLPLSQSSSSWAQSEWEKIGLEGLEKRLGSLPFAWNL
jgi:hypothetical protein